jgi:HK97 family phage major capsid protein
LSAPAIPSDAAGLMDTLSDPVKLKAIIDSPEGMTGFTKQFKDAFDARDKGASAEQIEAQVQKTIIEMANQSGAGVDFKRLNLGSSELAEAKWRMASAKQGAGYNPAALGATQDKEFAGTADFFRTIWHKQTDPDLIAKAARIQAAYTTQVPSDGGFLVPEAFRSQLLEPALESMLIRPRATVIPMESPRVKFPVLDVTSYASSVFGGMICYWTEEGAALTESQMKFAQIVLDANKLTGLAIANNESLRDSMISLAALIEQKWPLAIADFEDRGFHSGTGVGEPLGFMGNSAAVAVAKESTQLAATLLWENILEMYARMLPSSLPRAVWLYNPAAFRELGTMALSVGTGGSAVWLNNGAQGPPLTILGRPAYPDDKLAALGSQGDLVFVDLSYYLIGDRQAVTTDSSTDYRFGNDQTAFRVIERVDGRPWIQSAITPHNSGPTLSPFVELAVRA